MRESYLPPWFNSVSTKPPRRARLRRCFFIYFTMFNSVLILALLAGLYLYFWLLPFWLPFIGFKTDALVIRLDTWVTDSNPLVQEGAGIPGNSGGMVRLLLKQHQYMARVEIKDSLGVVHLMPVKLDYDHYQGLQIGHALTVYYMPHYWRMAAVDRPGETFSAIIYTAPCLLFSLILYASVWGLIKERRGLAHGVLILAEVVSIDDKSQSTNTLVLQPVLGGQDDEIPLDVSAKEEHWKGERVCLLLDPSVENPIIIGKGYWWECLSEHGLS